MSYFTVCTLLLIFVICFDISQSSDDCYYLPNHAGRKCYDLDKIKYTCCSPNHYCQNGKCHSLSVTSPSKTLPFHTSVVIGIGISVFCFVCLVIGGIYCHRKQMNNTENQLNPLSSFSQSSNVSTRSGSSAGIRIRLSTSQPSTEKSVNLEDSSNTTV